MKIILERFRVISRRKIIKNIQETVDAQSFPIQRYQDAKRTWERTGRIREILFFFCKYAGNNTIIQNVPKLNDQSSPLYSTSGNKEKT